MKRTIILLTAVVLSAASCSKGKGGDAKLRTDVDSVAYIIGMNVGMNLMKMDSTLNIAAVCEGMRDAYEGSARLSVADAETYYLRYVNYAQPEKVRAYEDRFLEDIVKSNRNFARTPSGVTYTVESVGDQNAIPSSDRDSVALRYIIRTAEGQEVFSSYERQDTLRSLVGDLQKGMQESVKLIGRGGKINAWMPSSTAYGASGDAKLGIRPNTTLYYEIELLGVDRYADRIRRNN